MENINELAALIVGFLLPLGISVVQQPKWQTATRAAILFISCVIAALIIATTTGDLTGKTFAEAGLLILVTAGATYKTLWKPTGIAGKIESMTSPKGKPIFTANNTTTIPDKLEPK